MELVLNINNKNVTVNVPTDEMLLTTLRNLGYYTYAVAVIRQTVVYAPFGSTMKSRYPVHILHSVRQVIRLRPSKVLNRKPHY